MALYMSTSLKNICDAESLLAGNKQKKLVPFMLFLPTTWTACLHQAEHI
jgi:hypothetical protein